MHAWGTTAARCTCWNAPTSALVQLDRDLKVVAMNSFARRALPVEDKQPFDKMVLSFHPERSQSKVKFLLDQAECPVSNPPPMTMIINIPERVLLIKVTKMADLRGDTVGYTLVFYDITDVVSREERWRSSPRRQAAAAEDPHRLENRIVLVDATRALRPLRRPLHLGPHAAGLELLQPEHRRPGSRLDAPPSCASTAATSPTSTSPSRSCATTAASGSSCAGEATPPAGRAHERVAPAGAPGHR